MTRMAHWHAEAIRMIDEGAKYREVAEKYNVTVQGVIWAVNYSATARGVQPPSEEERASRAADRIQRRKARAREKYRLAKGIELGAPLRPAPDEDTARRRAAWRRYMKTYRDKKKANTIEWDIR